MGIFKTNIVDLLLKRGHFIDRQAALSYINSGQVYANSKNIISPTQRVSNRASIEIKAQGTSFIDADGYKLADALSNIGVWVESRVCLDLLSNRAGFAEALIKNKASFVYCLDSKTIHNRRLIANENIKTISAEIKSLENLNLEKIPSLASVHPSEKCSCLPLLAIAKKMIMGEGDIILHIVPHLEVSGIASVLRSFSKEAYIRLINSIISTINSIDGLAVVKIIPSKYTHIAQEAEFFIHVLASSNVVAVDLDQDMISQCVDKAIEYSLLK